MKMYRSDEITTYHKDIVHDVAFNFYGKRMATCSSDHTVKIWDLDHTGNWICTSDFKAHTGPVWRVTWAHPEFGQVIATCSFDRTAVLWEEQVGDVHSVGNSVRTSCWIQRAPLVDSNIAVTDIKFAPKHLSLLLAMCYKDGVVRIYEAPDIMNLSYLSVQNVINCKLKSASCVSWNPSSIHVPMLAVGSDDPSSVSGGKVEIYCYSNNSRKWLKYTTLMGITESVHDVSFAPNVARSRHVLAIASRDVNIVSVQPLKEGDIIEGQQQHKESQQQQKGLQFHVRPDVTLEASLQDHDITHARRLRWNLTGTILCCTCDDGRLKMWKANYLENWQCIADIKKEVGVHPVVGGLQRAISQQSSTHSQLDMSINLQKNSMTVY